MVLLISCKKKDAELFVFDPKSLTENEITLSEIADDINYVPLSCNFPMSDISTSHNPMFVKNCFYQFDLNNGILVFSRDGTFLRRIGSIGRGPGEYLSGSRFAVDENTGKVYVCDSDNQIKIYSATGDFLKSFSIQKFRGAVDVISILNSCLFVSYCPQFDDAKYEWIILDTLGNPIKKKERSIPIFRSNYLQSGGTYTYGQKLGFWNPFLDTVFLFSPDFTYKPAFIFKQGEDRLPKKKIDNPLGQLPNFFMPNQIFETKKYLTIRYSFYKGKNGFIIIDKENHSTYLSYWEYDNLGSITNDLDGGLKILPRTYLVDNGREYLIEPIQPYQLKATVLSAGFKNSNPKMPDKKKEFEELAASLKETDNPVLMIVRLKK
jgi:hypothetical protein